MKVAAVLVATGAATASAAQQQPCFVPAVGASGLRQAAGAARSTSSLSMKLWDFGLNREVSAASVVNGWGVFGQDRGWKERRERKLEYVGG